MTEDGTIHISSAGGAVLPAHREEVVKMLATLPDLEIHYSDSWKIVIVMEALESGILGARLAEIASWQNVLSANMVFERIESFAEVGR